MKLLYYCKSDSNLLRVRTVVPPKTNTICVAHTLTELHQLLAINLFDILVIEKSFIMSLSSFFTHIRTERLHGFIALVSETETISAPELLEDWLSCNDTQNEESLLPVLKKLANIFAFNEQKKNELKLSRTENALLQFLIQNQDRDISITELATAVLGSANEKTINALYLHIHNLRKAIGDNLKEPNLLKRTAKGFYRLTKLL